MKNRVVAILTSLLLGVISCQATADATYVVSDTDVTITCDQTTKIVTFQFNNSSKTPRWSFHDGESSTERNVQKEYAQAGTYQVEVGVIGTNGTVEGASTFSFTLESSLEVDQYQLVWSDEFNGTTLNTNIWRLEQGYIANNELQNYQTSGNHEVSDGTLKIIARKVDDNKEYGSYTSARMISYYGQSFTYGRIEARIKIPSGVGTWPAFWMLGNSIMEGTSWPACGEIDIMEHVGYNPNHVHATLHYWDTTSNYTSQGDSIVFEAQNEWVVYGVLWTADRMQFYLNEVDNIYYEVATPTNKTNWPFNEPHFLLLNLAIGGDWGGVQGVDNTMFDATGTVQMEVDYVRAYQIMY